MVSKVIILEEVRYEMGYSAFGREAKKNVLKAGGKVSQVPLLQKIRPRHCCICGEAQKKYFALIIVLSLFCNSDA